MKNDINAAHEAEYEEVSDEASAKRTVVVPGEIIATGDDFLPGEGVRRDGKNVRANRFGLAETVGRVVKVIPLSGAFIPRRGNSVIGRITNITMNGWVADIDAAGSAFLPIAESPRFIHQNEMDQFLAIGDVISAKIWAINTRGTDLTIKGKGLGKLEGGFMFRINPTRVPRIIGREGSMINLIKDQTKCDISVGQNGWVWLRGSNVDDEIRARRAIEHVAENVHIGGLTDHMTKWFQEN